MIGEPLKEIAKSYYLEEFANPGNKWGNLLCVHGLNQNPQALMPLIEDLTELGLHCQLLHLPGHHDRTPSQRIDLESIYEGYRAAYERATHLREGKPIYLLGYSFGGLIGIRLLNDCPVEGVVLLAPALKLRTYAHWLRPVLPFLPKIPSVPIGPPEVENYYRYHRGGVPREVYQSFFEIYHDCHTQFAKNFPQGIKTPGRVWCHPGDELVSYSQLARWIGKNTTWRLKALTNKKASLKRYKHLNFDSRTLGEQNYQNVKQDIFDFLNPL